MSARYLMYLGCTVPVRNLNYELSARVVGKKLGLNFHDDPELTCCGFPMKGLDVRESLLLAARNLALAAARDMELCVLCNACAGTLTEAAHLLDHDHELRERVNQRLEKVGLSFQGGIKVRHFARILIEDVGLDTIKKAVTRPLEGWKFAPHYGCHYLKPSRVTGGFDDPEDPQTLKKLIELTGAESLSYDTLTDCCGGGLLGVDETLANTMSGRKIKELGERGADAIVLVCPFCNVMLEGQQKKITKALGIDTKIPVLYYPQVLGLALGFSPGELGFKLNRIKAKELVRAVEESAA